MLRVFARLSSFNTACEGMMHDMINTDRRKILFVMTILVGIYDELLKTFAKLQKNSRIDIFFHLKIKKKGKCVLEMVFICYFCKRYFNLYLFFMKIITDSGSTKTDWRIEIDDASEVVLTTKGINPYYMDDSSIQHILDAELMPQLKPIGSIDDVRAVEFYGAGCTPAMSPKVQCVLECFFSSAIVLVASDLLGAAKSLCGDSEGIACILGTGANSCLYDGQNIVSNVSPMGFILGDEGSGAVLGKTFLNELYKGDHRDLIPVFEKECNLTNASIIQKTYREPFPNRFLASLSPFIAEYMAKEEWIEAMVIDCFRNFFKRNVQHYHRSELPVHFVGSVAFYYEQQLREAAKLEGFNVGVIKKSPLQ